MQTTRIAQEQTAYQNKPILLPEPELVSVAGWLRELPLTNSEYSLVALLALLRGLVTKPDLSSATRLALADLVRPNAVMLAQRIEDHYIDAPLPYQPRAARQIEAASQIHRELGNLYAYSCPATRTRSGLLWQGGSNLCLTACFRSFQHWGQALLSTAALYREADLSFWPDLCRAYFVAEMHGVLPMSFDDTGEPPACRTPLGQFKRILLFAMADYCRYRQRDMRIIYELLGELADEADWDAQPEIGERRARFRIDLDGRSGPCRITETQAPAPSSRYLFIWRLIEHLLDKTLEQRSQFVALGGIRTRLPIHLAKSLFGSAHRRANRLPMRQKCALFVGFQKLTHALDPMLSVPADAPKHAPGRPRAVTSSNSPRLELVPLENWSLPERGEKLLRSNAVIEQILLDSWGSPREEIWKDHMGAESGNSSEEQGATGELLNTDPHGYCVLWCSGDSQAVQAGALIGIALDPHSTHIGVIRWLSQGEMGLRFGVELISPRAEIVHLWDGLGNPKGRGLLLPSLPAIRPEPEILLPPTGFCAGASLHLAGKRIQADFDLGKKRESTFCFSHFTLAPSTRKLAIK